MVDHPEKVVDDWVAIGAARVIIHIEAKGNIAEAAAELKEVLRLDPGNVHAREMLKKLEGN